MSDMDEGDRKGDTAYSGRAEDNVYLKQRGYASGDPRLKSTVTDGNDQVNHPSHYTFGKLEVIDVLFDWQLRYPLDNVLKYVARAGKKGTPAQEIIDLDKARFYLEYYIKSRADELDLDLDTVLKRKL